MISRPMDLTDRNQRVDDDATDHRFVGMSKRVSNRMTFETFDLDGGSNATSDERFSLKLAMTAATEFAGQPIGWLYLHGPTGVGKTHIAAAIANYRIQKGNPVTFRNVPELLHRMRRTLSQIDGANYYARFEKLRNSELLILDDLIQGQMTDWALDTLLQLIVYRYERLLPTAITSRYIIWEGADNTSLNSVERKHQWESIRSRLSDSRVVTERLMAAPDYRNRGA